MTATNNKIALGKTNLAILNGTEDLTLWSDEELLRGHRKDRNGRWSGRPPKVVPLAVHQELTRRRLDEAYQLLREDLVGAVQLLGQVVRDKEADNKDRIKAAELIINRVMGKPTERVELSTRSRWEEALDTALVYSDEDVIDATAVPDDDG